MLKHSIGKKVIAFASAAALTASATVASLSALDLSASATDTTLSTEVGEGTFNEGKGLPWHICESATGEMSFDITDGIYAILIKNPGGTGNGGEDRWDCQFRHRNLTIENGHKYRLTYSVNPTKSGKMYAKIGDMVESSKEYWHGNGTKLSMTYEAGISLEDLATKLKSASSTGETVDYGQGWDAWKNVTIPANTWTTYAYEFTSDKETASTAEWTFHMGGVGTYTSEVCFAAGTIVRFDNLCLIDMTDSKTDYVKSSDYEVTDVEVNQVGYYTKASKKATIKVSQGDTTKHSFEVQQNGKTVYSGTTDGTTIYDEGAWDYYQICDFTDFTTAGTDYTVVVDGNTSLPFEISDTLYSKTSSDGTHTYGADMLTYALNYFYQNRSGEDTQSQYIPSPQTVEGSGATLARKDAHNPDTAYISDEWVYIYTSKPTYSQTVDLTGGWYDAGDYGKYVVNGGVSLWTLMNMYERSIAVDKADKWADGSELMNIPETGDGIPDILNECKYELDFFLEMQRTDGMVYHKMHDYKWTGLAVAPFDDDNDPAGSVRPMRITKPVTLAATLNFAASCAQASRLFEDYDASYASTLLTQAKKAYEAAKTNYVAYTGEVEDGGNSVYAPLKQNKGGGAYGDNNVSDEFYWAACELYATTEDKTYYTDLTAYGDGSNKYGDDNGKAFEVSYELYGGENNGTFSLFTWGTLNSIGTISLYENSAKLLADGALTEAEVKTMKDSIVNAADQYIEQQNKSAFAIPYHGHTYTTSVWYYDEDTLNTQTTSLELENGYEWGSNSIVINNTMAIALAYDITKDVKYIDGTTEAFDYLLGRNALEQSYVTGYGEHSTKYPHHRWWSGQLNPDEFPYAPYGVLSGGCNSEMNDPMIMGAGYKLGTLAPMKCYLDNVEAWSVNECTINWNSPLCWVVSFIEDEAPEINRDGVTTTTTTASDDTTTTTAVGESLVGDVDVDGDVDLADSVVLNKAVAGSVQLQGVAQKNADTYGNDSAINSKDAAAVGKFLTHNVTSLPEL